uniref:S8 family serine peptidase n=1 Tax=Parasphingorhabdus sp. TaxID=2709688 RepID=UPI002B272698
GTSFAAPFVSGAAALLVSRGVRRAHPINADTVRRILLRTAQPFSRGNPGGCGAGILDSAAALRALDAEIDAVQDDFPERVADPPNHGGADDG